MPELPEVETYVRELEPLLQGQIVRGVTVRWSRSVAAPTVPAFVQAMQGKAFVRFERRGKYMLFGLAAVDRRQPSGGQASAKQRRDEEVQQTLLVHLRMTGRLIVYATPTAPSRHTHVIFDLVDGKQLHFQDSRKFGRIWLVDHVETVLAKLGPEPLQEEFQVEDFAKRLSTRTTSIKALLLDQAVVAGVGNIYADESLHLAGIHPARAGNTLTQTEVTKLHAAIQTVLEQAIAGRGSSLGGSNIQNYQRPSGEPGAFQNQHRVFQRTGQPCLTCGEPIMRITLAQRSTHFCPHCQPLP
ncbi:MAG: bifunctional DNA-formamidopyrimidine glycosylase/DNA-(apurinic or apyrimidinic site) lyase [Caldilineaceae bacterium]|nr:bifunctional DNA-formamidopyrimidine glycosylase/DNA-(apurinic or apyrimidinic site) lyase [Caldilineaceae bacterium]